MARICERLDGIPLAIELAAARVGLSVEQIAVRLDDSLKLLTTGSRTATARQKTLRGALDWSSDLLSRPEQVLFGRLSVFAGGWTLEAADAVGAGEDIEEGEVFDLLLRLVDKSLVVAEATGQGAVRYRMLELVRQYALEKLDESGKTKAARRAHAHYFLALAEEAELELRRREQVAWLRRLDDEHDNFRAVLAWALDREDAELGLRLAGSLAEFWVVRGHYTDGRRWLKEVLTKDAAASNAVRAKASLRAGRFMQTYGDEKQAETSIKAGLELYRELGDRVGIARSLLVLGDVSLDQGDLTRARLLLEESLALSRELGDDDTLAQGLCVLGWLDWDQGDVEQGKSLLEESLRLNRKIGDINGICGGLTDLGIAAIVQGDYERATTLTEEGLALNRDLGNRTITIYLLYNLGTIALERGDHERAAALLRESLELNRELDNKRSLADLIEGIAGVAGARGEAVRAARLYGAAEAVREAVGYPVPAAERPLYERHMAVASSLINEEKWSEEWAKGKTMELRQAIEYALYDEERPAPSRPEQPSASAQPPILTRREREVATLVARGLTNRRIATELFVSERTVDHHVSNILKKLGLRSRDQVASRLEAP